MRNSDEGRKEKKRKRQTNGLWQGQSRIKDHEPVHLAIHVDSAHVV